MTLRFGVVRINMKFINMLSCVCRVCYSAWCRRAHGAAMLPGMRPEHCLYDVVWNNLVATEFLLASRPQAVHREVPRGLRDVQLREQRVERGEHEGTRHVVPVQRVVLHEEARVHL